MTTPDPLANPIKPEDDTQASIPAPEAPSFPQASAPAFDEATATPGTTTYGTAYDPAGAAPEAQDPPGCGDPAISRAGNRVADTSSAPAGSGVTGRESMSYMHR